MTAIISNAAVRQDGVHHAVGGPEGGGRGIELLDGLAERPIEWDVLSHHSPSVGQQPEELLQIGIPWLPEGVANISYLPEVERDGGGGGEGAERKACRKALSRG